MIDMTAHFQEEANTASNRTNILYTSPTWDYFCNASMQEIIPGVYLGPNSTAQLHCLTNLMEKGIRYIICVRQDLEAHFIRPQISDPSFTYLTLDIADHVTENIIRFFPKVNHFIEEALSKNANVLIHGNNGNSRSATLVMAYIMEKFGLGVSDAIGFVKTKRATVNPNEGFKAQLFEYEPIYKARQMLSNGESSYSNKSRCKRKCEQLCDTDDTCGYDLVQPPPSPIACDNNNYEVTNNSPSNNEFSNHVYRLLVEKRFGGKRKKKQNVGLMAKLFSNNGITPTSSLRIKSRSRITKKILRCYTETSREFDLELLCEVFREVRMAT